jgi:hypothetical protein
MGLLSVIRIPSIILTTARGVGTHRRFTAIATVGRHSGERERPRFQGLSQ